MKKLLLSTLILTSGLVFPLDIKKNHQAQPAANNQQNTYVSDLDAIEKELQEALKKGNTNPTQPQEDALAKLDTQLATFVTGYCPLTNGKHTFNNKIALDSALSTLDKFEIFANKIHAELSKNDSIFVMIYPKWYCDKAKKAHVTIKNIQNIKNDISPTNYFVNKFKDGKKWVFASKTNFALTVAAAMAGSATTRFLFKEHNGWIQPMINAGTTIASNVLLPIFNYITWR